MLLHLSQIAVVTDMIAYAVFLNVRVNLGLAAILLRDFEGLEDGAGIQFPSAEIIRLAASGVKIESVNEPRYILRVDVVSNLFAFVTEYPVLPSFQIALD